MHNDSVSLSQTGSSECKQNKTRESLPLLPAVYDINPLNYSSIESSSKCKLPSGESTLLGVTFNLLNALVGAGILSIPYSYSKCGIFGGIGLMIIFAMICTYTLNLQIIAGQSLNVVNYEDLGYESFGYIGYIGVSLSMFLLDIGVLLTCLIIIGDSAFAVMKFLGYKSYFDRQIIILIVSLIIIFPLCLRRDIAHIEIFSIFKLITLLSVTAVIIYECIQHFMQSNISIDAYQDGIKWFDINGIPFALGIFAFSFVCHDTAFLYYNSLYNPTMWRWTRLSFAGIGSAMFLSVIISVPAYLTFTNNADGNILNNYQVNNVLIIIIRIIYIICMALTYPIPLFVIRHIVYAVYMRWNQRNQRNQQNQFIEDQVIENVKNAPLKHHIPLTCIIFFSTLITSMFVDNLGITMSIIGSLTSINLAFVFPSIFYIKSSKYYWSFWKYNTNKQRFLAFLALYPPLFLSIFGAGIGIYSVITTLTSK